MAEVQQLMNWLLAILPVGTGITIVRCLIVMNAEPDSSQTYIKRIRNAFLFFIIAETATGLLSVIAGYYQ